MPGLTHSQWKELLNDTFRRVSIQVRRVARQTGTPIIVAGPDGEVRRIWPDGPPEDPETVPGAEDRGDRSASENGKIRRIEPDEILEAEARDHADAKP